MRILGLSLYPRPTSAGYKYPLAFWATSPRFASPLSPSLPFLKQVNATLSLAPPSNLVFNQSSSHLLSLSDDDGRSGLFVSLHLSKSVNRVRNTLSASPRLGQTRLTLVLFSFFLGSPPPPLFFLFAAPRNHSRAGTRVLCLLCFTLYTHARARL